MIDSGLMAATLTIDGNALATNWRTIAAAIGAATAGAVVKADGYGLGAVPVAKTLLTAGCRHFFVAHLSEAKVLRDADILPEDASVYILNGLMPGGESLCAAINAIPVLNSPDQIARWAELATTQGQKLPAAIQVDTGMSRLGLPLEEIEALLASPELLASIDIRLLMSHLACADTPDVPANEEQARVFNHIASLFPGIPRALDNSGGSFLPRAHYDIVRPGIALYGGSPNASDINPMQPVIRLTTQIIQLRTIQPGTGVGYGLSFVAERPTRIATIPVGYADGWPRHLSGKGAAFIAGHRAPIAGRVSMDSITLDVTDVPVQHVYPGAPVELLGPHQSIDDVAQDAGTISYEILTRLGHRYERVWSTPDIQSAEREIAR